MIYGELVGIWHIIDSAMTRCGKPFDGLTYEWREAPRPLCSLCREESVTLRQALASAAIGLAAVGAIAAFAVWYLANR
jgi:hypothetical protein